MWKTYWRPKTGSISPNTFPINQLQAETEKGNHNLHVIKYDNILWYMFVFLNGYNNGNIQA